MNLELIRTIGKEFEQILKLKTKPIGIKFFESVDDVPKGYEWVNRKKVICNIIGFSRFYEIPVAITSENTNHLCPVADLSMGIGQIPEGFAEKAVGGFAKNLEQTSKIFDGMKTFEQGKYAAIGVCPLEFSLIVPDVIQIWGNPTQMLELEYANTWNHGDGKIELITNGHGASCYETLSWPIVEDKLRFAIADMGDKRHGYASDSDMILGLPVGKIEELLEGLKATMNTLNRLPVLYNFDDIDFPVPSYALAHSPYLKKK
jgi:uncharacterized protein (DUF169 family)